MSIKIGVVERPGNANPAVHVLASTGGVELQSDEMVNLTPAAARNYAALLMRAAEEVERMRTPKVDEALSKAVARYDKTRTEYGKAVTAMSDNALGATARLHEAVHNQAVAAIALADLITKDS